MTISWPDIFESIKKFVEVFTKWLDEVGQYLNTFEKKDEDADA